MNIKEILVQDYQRFPVDQTYSIYDPDVYFQDPLNKFRGIKRYQKMIKFISTWFKEIRMDVHDIEQKEHIIQTKWTLSWTAPLLWKRRIAITGRSELTLNENNLIISHIDYWDKIRLTH